MYCKQQVVIAAWRNISGQCETLVKTLSPRYGQCCHMSVFRVRGVHSVLPRRVSRQCDQLLNVGFLRLASSSVTPTPAPTPAVSLPEVPEPPPAPDVPDVAAEVLQAGGEQSFASIGLGGWSPVGIVQNCLEYLHIDCGLPWWSSIVIGTVVVRTLLFPLVIVAQRNAAKMNNYLPQLQILQLKLTEARETGNQLEAARYTQELALFMKEKGLNPFKNMLVPLAQAPVFISFFLGLRGMTNMPVESMRTGGLFWFVDLTVPDQYFILPIITSATMYLTIELGTDGTRLSSSNLQTMRYVLRALPVCILPFTINFPGVSLKVIRGAAGCRWLIAEEDMVHHSKFLDWMTDLRVVRPIWQILFFFLLFRNYESLQDIFICNFAQSYLKDYCIIRVWRELPKLSEGGRTLRGVGESILWRGYLVLYSEEEEFVVSLERSGRRRWRS